MGLVNLEENKIAIEVMIKKPEIRTSLRLKLSFADLPKRKQTSVTGNNNEIRVGVCLFVGTRDDPNLNVYGKIYVASCLIVHWLRKFVAM